MKLILLSYISCLSAPAYILSNRCKRNIGCIYRVRLHINLASGKFSEMKPTTDLLLLNTCQHLYGTFIHSQTALLNSYLSVVSRKVTVNPK